MADGANNGESARPDEIPRACRLTSTKKAARECTASAAHTRKCNYQGGIKYRYLPKARYLIKSLVVQDAGERNAISAEINLPHRRVPFAAMKLVSRKE